MATDRGPWWMDAVKTLGLPTVFLGVVTFMIWSAGSWAGEKVIMPLFNKQMTFIDEASKMTSEMNRTTSLINQTLQAHGEHAIETLRISSDTQKVVMMSESELKGIQRSHEEMIRILEKIESNTDPIRELAHPQTQTGIGASSGP